MGRAYLDNNATLHVEEDGVETAAFVGIHARLMARLAENQAQYGIVTERHEDDPDDDPMETWHWLPAVVIGVVLAVVWTYGTVVWWRP